MKPKIGYLPIANFETERKKVCETPRHESENIPAFAVVAVQADVYPEGIVLMVCMDCWKHFDDDMHHPEWNLIELEKKEKAK
jgi:galactose mutarotase-like enzyme